MAYGRKYWRRYYRSYYKGKYSSYGKTKLSKNFKASANNMTQGGTFNISVRFEDNVIFSGDKDKWKPIDVAGKIAASDMHTYLSNVFDQYRIEKLIIRIKPAGDTINGIGIPSILFTAMDRTKFANTVTIDQIRTYGSYKETMVSGSKDISPTHYCNIGQSNLVEWSTYTDTKNKASFPNIIWGMSYAAAATNTSYVSIEIDAMVRYRGVRLDTAAVQPEPELYDANVKDFSTYSIVNGQIKPINGIRGTDFTWATANTTVTVDQDDLLVVGRKTGPYVLWTASWRTGASTTESINANSYYGVLTNVTNPHYFGSYEEDEIADFFSNFGPESYGYKTTSLWIQGDHMDSTIYTHWFSS